MSGKDVQAAGINCPRCILGTELNISLFYQPALCYRCKRNYYRTPDEIIQEHKLTKLLEGTL